LVGCLKLIESQTGVKMQAQIDSKDRLARALDSSSWSFSSSSSISRKTEDEDENEDEDDASTACAP
jgi:hypothetical protein